MTAVDPGEPARVFSPIDLEFATFLAAWGGKSGEDKRICTGLGALLSNDRGHGHSYIDLKEYENTVVDLDGNQIRLPAAEDCLASLSGLVSPDGHEPRPLVLDAQTHLYLYRYYQAETRLAAFFRDRAAAEPSPLEASTLVPAFQALFPPLPDGETDWQAVAVFSALRQPYAVIAGGAGTGKTTTVAKLLTLYRLLHPEGAIAMAAPTGKAASRLKESIQEKWNDLAASLGRTDLTAPEDARTIHRLLGQRFPSGTLRHHAGNPLPCDLLLVDESSMVDLLMMDALARALKPGAKLVLLGDPNQLASIETGSVLHDLCDAARNATPARRNEKSASFRSAYAGISGVSLPPAQEAGPLQDTVTTLTRAFRYQADAAALQELAGAVLDHNAEKMLDILHAAQSQSCIAYAPPEPDAIRKTIEAQVDASWTHIEDAPDEQTITVALQTLEHWRILSPVYKGPCGVDALNAIARDRLRKHTGDPSFFCRLQPIMIEGNHYGVRLMNGDMGVCWPDGNGRMQVHFSGEHGTIRTLPPASLPAHDSAFALSIHKSQGSEYDHVVIVLPQTPSRLLIPELLYTAVTRAKSRITLFATDETLSAALQTHSKRRSGLRDRLS